MYGFPVSILLTGFCCWLLIKVYIKDSAPISIPYKDINARAQRSGSRVQQVIALVVLIVTMFFWSTSTWFDIPIASISAIPIVFLTLTGIITGKDIRALPWDILFLVAGGLSLGLALESTGILEHYANQMKTLNTSEFIFLLILAYAAAFLSNTMSNSATTTILASFGLAFLSNDKSTALTIGLCSSMALFFPISTPPQFDCLWDRPVRAKRF